MSTEVFKLAVFISGRGSNLRALVEHTKQRCPQIRVALVVSDKRSAQGLEFAKSHNIPTEVVQRKAKEQSSQSFNRALVAAVEPYKPDLIVLAGFMRLLTEDFINSFNNKIINIHPSLLPAFKGLRAQEQALAAGVKFAGCTVHYVVEECDSGPIIAQSVVPVLPNDTVETLSQRILAQEHQILPESVQAIAEGKIWLTQEGVLETASFT